MDDGHITAVSCCPYWGWMLRAQFKYSHLQCCALKFAQFTSNDALWCEVGIIWGPESGDIALTVCTNPKPGSLFPEMSFSKRRFTEKNSAAHTWSINSNAGTRASSPFFRRIKDLVQLGWCKVGTVLSPLSAPHTIPTTHDNASLLVKWAIAY